MVIFKMAALLMNYHLMSMLIPFFHVYLTLKQFYN
ncbi:hypothetical protein SA58113_2232 [Staphylococcus argenteus]|nr:hypothetical protein SA58113_2232 [Staphylococcus argenteus]